MKKLTIKIALLVSLFCSTTFAQKKDSIDEKPISNYVEMVKAAMSENGSLIKSYRLDEQVIHLAVKGKENWNVFLSYSRNEKYLFVVFPCQKIDKIDGELARKLLEDNDLMGLSRFELRDGILRISTPCSTANVSPQRLNQLLEHNIEQARRSVRLWGASQNKTAESTKTAEPTESTDKGAVGQQGTDPTHGFVPSSPGEQGPDVVGEICKGDQMRMGTMQINSIADKTFSGLINFAPNGEFAMQVTNEDGGDISLQGTYELIAGKLRLIADKPGSDEKMFFDYAVTERKADGSFTLTSEQDSNDSITLFAQEDPQEVPAASAEFKK